MAWPLCLLSSAIDGYYVRHSPVHVDDPPPEHTPILSGGDERQLVPSSSLHHVPVKSEQQVMRIV